MSKRLITKNYKDKRRVESFTGAPAFTKGGKYKDPKKIREILFGITVYSTHRPVRKHRRPNLAYFPHLNYSMDVLQLSVKMAEREKFGFILLVSNLGGFRNFN